MLLDQPGTHLLHYSTATVYTYIPTFEQKGLSYFFLSSLDSNQVYSACYPAETAHETRLNQLVQQSRQQALRV